MEVSFKDLKQVLAFMWFVKSKVLQKSDEHEIIILVHNDGQW